MTENDFYQHVAGILGVETDSTPFPYPYRTRWNNRGPGRGRYPGVGIIRMFGDTVHVALTAPVAVNRILPSPEAALAFLTEIALH